MKSGRVDSFKRFRSKESSHQKVVRNAHLVTLVTVNLLIFFFLPLTLATFDSQSKNERGAESGARAGQPSGSAAEAEKGV